MKSKTVSASNVISDPTQTLQRFDLLELQQYTREKSYSGTASKDFHLFYVGRDDVHDILKYVLSRASVSLYMNMLGFDDDELNDIVMTQARDPSLQHVGVEQLLLVRARGLALGVFQKRPVRAGGCRNRSLAVLRVLSARAFKTHLYT